MRNFVVILFLTVQWSIVWAQEDQVKNAFQLTFEKAVSMGLANNVTLNQSRNQLAYTKVNKTSSLLQLGPSVRANGDAYRVEGNSFNQNEGTVVNGQIDYVNASLNASMPVFNGFNTLNKYKQANSINDAQLHLVNRTQQDVITLVSNQYLLCLLDKQLIKIADEDLGNQQVQYNRIETQVDLGSVAEADLFAQEFQVKNAELTLLRAKIKLRQDMATLAQTIQLDPAIAFELEEIEWDVNIAIADTLSLDQMYSTALSRRSDLSQVRESEKAARFGYSARKGLYFPSLYAGASFGSRYNYIHGFENRTFNDQFTDDNRQVSYGLSLVIPIYGGFSNRAATAQSRVTFENAKLLHESTKLIIKSEVLGAYQNFKDAIANYEASTAKLKAAERSFQMEDERYNLGASDLIQRATVNQAFVRAQGDYQSALFTLMFQRILMDYALGTLNNGVIDQY